MENKCIGDLCTKIAASKCPYLLCGRCCKSLECTAHKKTPYTRNYDRRYGSYE